MLTKFKIIGSGITIAVLSIASVTAYAHFTHDYRKDVSNYESIANDYMRKAHEAECTVVGQLISACFAGNTVKCGELKREQEIYQSKYQTDAQVDCTGTGTPNITDSSSSSLFLGDEGQKLPQ